MNNRAHHIVILAMALASCTGGDPAADPTSTTPAEPPTLTLIGENIELLPGPDLALRIGFEATTPSAQIIVTSRPDTARVSVCPLSAIDDPLPPIEECRRDIGSGVREPVSAPDMRAVALLLRGEAAVRSSIRLEYPDGGRTIDLRFPRLRAPTTTACEDNACNAFFELIPTAGGPFEARATWSGPAGTLVLQQGSILGRSQRATGVPYAEAARDDGAAPLSIATRLRAPGEYALAFFHRVQRPGEPALRDVVISARWPASS